MSINAIMHECVILFIHHENDPVTNNNLRIVRQSNPDYPVIPIYRNGVGVDGAINVSSPETDNMGGKENIDIHLMEWFKRFNVPAKRYVYMESDVFATQNFKEFFSTLWDEDCVGMNVWRKAAHKDKWFWFKYKHLAPEHMQQYATGLDPYALFLISRRALDAVCKLPVIPGMFCELRMSTMVKASGFQVCCHPYGSETVMWRNIDGFDGRNVIKESPKVRGVYHPVKDYLLDLPT